MTGDAIFDNGFCEGMKFGFFSGVCAMVKAMEDSGMDKVAIEKLVEQCGPNISPEVFGDEQGGTENV